jgi:hypothetical protein
MGTNRKCMVHQICHLFTNENNNFFGNTNYWKGKTVNETIRFRHDIHQHILNKGFTKEIQREILKWGGIHRFNQFEKVVHVLSTLNNEQAIDTDTANAISSFSKLFAFYCPQNYFILDARVSYVINKIILINQIETPLINFKINRSRNRNLIVKYEEMMNAIPGNHQFIDIADYYIQYCALIKETYTYLREMYPDIFENRDFIFNSPEIIEMFLFYLADHI